MLYGFLKLRRHRCCREDFLFAYLAVNCLFVAIKGQFQTYNQPITGMVNEDEFKKELCRERWRRLDWQSILQPCFQRTKFGENLLPSSLRTNAFTSRIWNMDIKKAGEYSKLTIQTVDQFGLPKTFGGDTWRVLITGPSSMQPFVHDMNNGYYEIPFLILEPGKYRADIYLEGTLCSQYFDPPADWFQKGDYNGHFQEPHMFASHFGWSKLLKERLWEKLGGNFSVINFEVYTKDEARYMANMAKLQDWQKVCQIPDKCNFIWDGFGRWVGTTWKPYNENEGMDKRPEWKYILKAKRRKRGTLWLYGDCFAHHFFEMVWNKTLCRSVFEKCGETYNWVYPRLHPVHELDPSIHRKDPSDFSISKVISHLEAVLDRDDMDEDSALIINYGLHLVRSTSFENYQKLIQQLIEDFANYDGEVVWRTTTSIWRQQLKVHKRFQTNQRAELFNAFANSAMCNAGIPILDVFPITASTWKQPEDGIHYEISLLKPVDNALINYFKDDAEEKR